MIIRSMAAVVCALLLASPLIAQRNLKDIPDPDPELERKTFVVADGFEVNLFAADPKIAKPIQMNFDAQGRLWIASSEVYPHIKPGQKATDKILVLEDANADGKADKTTVFADGLLIPTGVLPGDGGAYVVNSTELLHLADTDDDGQADQRRIVLSGFGTEDTHHLLHTLRWGHDGCLYMNQSIYIHSHVETPYGVRRLNGGGIWRFRPETMELEIFCRGFVNPWGHHQDHWGQSFATDGAYGEGINYVFPGAIFVTAPGEKRRLTGLNPGSPKHCGLEITSGRHLPPEWRGNMITNDFRAHRVCRFVVSEDGSGYASRQEAEVIKSSHVAFRPIDVKMGPDGAIYIADWYNPIIQHGEVDFRDPRRDHVHGRIWRVSAKGRPLVERQKIVGAKIDDLLDMLLLPEEWTRLWAKQELKTRDEKKVIAALRTWMTQLDPAETDLEHAALEAHWLLQTINRTDPAGPDGLFNDAKDARVRAAAVRICSQQRDVVSRAEDVFARAVADEHPRVRLEGVRALAESQSAKAAEIATRVLDQPMDRFLDFALWQAMRDLKPLWLPALEKGEIDFGGNVEHLTFALKAVDSPQIVELLLKRLDGGDLGPQQATGSASLIAQLGNAQQLHRLLFHATDAKSKLPAALRAAILQSMLAGTKQRQVRLTGDMRALAELTKADDEALRIAAIRAAGAWRVKEAAERVGLLAADGGNPPPALRRAALAALGDNGDAASLNTLMAVAAHGEPADMRGYAIEQLAGVKIEHAARLAATFLATQAKPQHVEPIIAAVTTHKDGSAALTKQLDGQKLKADVAKLALRAARAAPGDTAALQSALRTSGGLTGAPKKWSADEINALAAEVAQSGDAARGEVVFRRAEMQCLKCHAVGGAGGKVGPDLISIGASAQVDYLVQSMVDPNAKVKENFHSIIVETAQGKVFSGVPVQRNDKQIVLRDANDQEVTIAAADVDVVREGRSLMPEGLVEPLTRGELVDLVRFLSALGKQGDFAIGKEQVVRRWETLVWTPEAHRKLNRSSHDSAAGDDPAFTWVPAYSRVSGQLPVENLAKFVPHRDLPPVSFVRCELEVTTPGKVGLNFGNAQGLTLWINGKPSQLADQLDVELPRGRHRLTLAIDRQKRTDPLRVELLQLPDSPARAALIGGK